MATVLAASSGLVFAVVIWFVLTRYFGIETTMAAAIAALIGGAEYFVLRYILSQKYTSPDDDI